MHLHYECTLIFRKINTNLLAGHLELGQTCKIMKLTDFCKVLFLNFTVRKSISFSPKNPGMFLILLSNH